MKKIILILIILLTLAVLLFLPKLFPSSEKEIDTRETKVEEKTEDTITEMKTVDELNNHAKEEITNEVFLSFKEGVDSATRKEIFEHYDISIIDSDDKNNGYLVQLNNIFTEDELADKIDKLKNEETIEHIFENKKALTKSENLTKKAYENFNLSLDVYQDNANTYIRPGQKETFLYPVSWIIEEGNILKDTFTKGSIQYELIDRPTDIKKLIETLIPSNFQIDGDLDSYIRIDGTEITKWVINNGEIIQPQALLKSGETIYYLNANEHTNFSEFALIVDSFTFLEEDKDIN